MKVSLVAVVSINGKITQGFNSSIAAWASKEDSVFFKKMLAKHTAVVMGNNTYKEIKPRPSNAKLRVIMSKNPKAISSNAHVPGQIEFTNATPKAIVDDLYERGHSSVLVLGGSQIYSQFLDSGLVSDIYLTVEPTIFNDGLDMLSNLKNNVKCSLVKAEVLNKQGTLLLHYKSLS